MGNEITFDSQSHTYRVGNQVIISVTQAIKMAGLINNEWFTEESRNRGRIVHLATQFDDEGDLDEATIDPMILPYVEAARKFKADTGFKPELIEQRIYHPTFGYAGTVDRVGTMGKHRVVLDYKSGVVPFWCRLQTAGYSGAMEHGSQYLRYGVQLKPDATYKISAYEPKDFRNDVGDFMAVLRTSQILREAGCRQ